MFMKEFPKNKHNSSRRKPSNHSSDRSPKFQKTQNKKTISYSLPKLDVDCMITSMNLETRRPIACGIPKFHKGKGNLPSHILVLVVVGSPFYCISRCVDMCLRQLLDQTPSYVKKNQTA